MEIIYIYIYKLIQLGTSFQMFKQPMKSMLFVQCFILIQIKVKEVIAAGQSTECTSDEWSYEIYGVKVVPPPHSPAVV